MNQIQIKNVFNYSKKDIKWADDIEKLKDCTDHNYFRYKNFNLCKCDIAISDSDLEKIIEGKYDKDEGNILFKYRETHEIIRCDRHERGENCSGYEIDCHNYHNSYVDEMDMEQCDYQ